MNFVVFLILIILISFVVMKAQKRKDFFSLKSLIGTEAKALSDISPSLNGKIFIDGEYWTASAHEEIKKDETVEIVKVENMIITVKKK